MYNSQNSSGPDSGTPDPNFNKDNFLEQMKDQKTEEKTVQNKIANKKEDKPELQPLEPLNTK